MQSNMQNKKNFWCRDTLWPHMVKTLGFSPFKEVFGARLRHCTFDKDKCRGAHSLDDISVLPNIDAFNKIDKGKYNWIKLYQSIITVLNDDYHKLKSEEHKKLIDDIKMSPEKTNFIKLIQLWRYLAYHYRKVVKNFYDVDDDNKLKQTVFSKVDDVPEFNLPKQYDEFAWCFSRITLECYKQKYVDKVLTNKNEQITVWDLCLATGINCKDGIHKQSEMLCFDDFLTGKCSCTDNLDMKEKELNDMIELMKTELNTMDDFKVVNKNKKGNKNNKTTKDKVLELTKELELLCNNRKIHYSEVDMIPFDIQLNAYLEEESRKTVEIIKEKEKDIERYDHGLMNCKEITKEVKKLIKPGSIKK